MANPKFLPVAKKIPYNIRLPKPLLDKLNAYAELTGNTTTDVVITTLTEFMKDKTVFNTYLDDVIGVTIKIPVFYDEKAIFMNNVNLLNYSGVYTDYNAFGESFEETAKTDPYEILKIPNNLDVFNVENGFNSDNDLKSHSGIEFVILPDTYDYIKNTDIFNALYCFYFVVSNNKLVSITLIDYLTAINKLTESNNIKIKNNLILCVDELKQLKEKIESENVGADEKPGMIELIEIAKKYNTGYIIPLGDNIIESIADVEIKENPDYYAILQRILTIFDEVDNLSDDQLMEIFAKKRIGEKEPDDENIG
ncbi:hypothetical protein IKD56_00085 [bacterium]|nr:hypothetical protein [bacterium]MBR2651792.1 hypothetical protein [bacterium]